MSEDRSIAGQLLWWAERVRCMCLIQIYCIFHVKKSKCSVAINHITNTHTHTRYCGGKKTRVSGKENDIWGLLHRPTLWNNDKYCYKSVSACNDKADKDISYSCTYVSMHMPVQNKIISKILNTKDKKYSFQHQSCRPHKSSYISWDIHTHTHRSWSQRVTLHLGVWDTDRFCWSAYAFIHLYYLRGGKKGITYKSLNATLSTV